MTVVGNAAESERAEAQVACDDAEAERVGRQKERGEDETMCEPCQQDDLMEEEDVISEPKFVRSPISMSAKEYAAHRKLHMPYHPGCPICVAGRGRADPHHATSPEEQAVPVIGVDFFFVSDESDTKNMKMNKPARETDTAAAAVGPEDEEQRTRKTVPALAIRDSKARAVFANVIPSKGLDWTWTAQQVIADIGKMGYRKVVLRSDQEPAVSALLDKIKELRNEETIIEWAPRFDSDAHGLAERAVQAVEGQVRTMKLELESRLKGRVPVEHPIFTWLMRHAADVISKVEVKRATGRTAYEMLKGRRYTGTFAEFGQKVHYMVAQRPRGGDMQQRWHTGIWLGKLWRSDEHLLFSSGRVVRARCIRGLPETDSWSRSEVDAVTATPWNLESRPEEAPAAVRIEEMPTTQPKEEADAGAPPRGVRIGRKELEKYGYTAGCRKCDIIRRNLNILPTLGHSDACRRRILQAMREDDDVHQQGKVEAARQRQEEYRARQGEGASAAETTSTDVSAPPGTTSGTTSAETRTKRKANMTEDEESGKRSRPAASEPSSSSSSGSGNTNPGPKGASPKPQKREHSDRDADVEPVSKRAAIRSDDLDAIYSAACSSKASCMVAELFSPSRTVPHAAAAGFRRGWSMDINAMDPVTGRCWDLSDAVQQRRVLRMIRCEKPWHIMLSPPCTMFSSLQGLNPSRGTREWQARRRHAVALLHFAMEVARVQLQSGRYFTFEHPLAASSWTEPCVREILLHNGVDTCVLDMCAYGLVSTDASGEAPAKKATKLMSNMPAVIRGMVRRCPGRPRHVKLLGGGAGPAAKYTESFCRRLAKCLEVQCLAEGGAPGIVQFISWKLMSTRTATRSTRRTSMIAPGSCCTPAW